MRINTLLLLAILLSVATACPAQCGPAGCPVRPAPSSQPDEVPSAIRQAAAATIRIVHQERSGASLGSGTVVAVTDEAAWILTCAHLFTEPGETRVQLRSQTAGARLVAIDRRHDLALLKTSPLEAMPVQVKPTTRLGDLFAGGFGPSGVLRFIRGKIIGTATAQGASAPSLRIRGTVRSGDSGGPVFNSNGELVAVVWGQRDGETFAMGGEPLRRIITRLPTRNESLQPVPRSPASRDVTEKPNRRPSDTPADDLARRDDLRDLSAQWDQRFERLRGEIIAGVATRPSAETTIINQLSRWAAGEALLALGAGAAPVAVAIWGWQRWRRKKRVELPGSTTSHEERHPVAVDTPPPPQRVVPKTHYVSYERDEFARAHQWASEQLVRKFPGAVEMLASLDSLIRQQLNADEQAQ